MKTIKVENEDVRNRVDEEYKEIHSLERLVSRIAKQIRAAEDRLWKTIQHEYKETEGFNCRYDGKTGIIYFLHPIEEAE